MNTLYRNDDEGTLLVHDPERGLVAGFHLPMHIDPRTGELKCGEFDDLSRIDVTDFLHHPDDNVPDYYQGFREWPIVPAPEEK